MAKTHKRGANVGGTRAKPTTERIDWRARRAACDGLPPLAPLPAEIASVDVDGLRRLWCVSTSEVDFRAHDLRTIDDPLCVLAIVAPHMLPHQTRAADTGDTVDATIPGIIGASDTRARVLVVAMYDENTAVVRLPDGTAIVLPRANLDRVNL